MPHYDDSFLDSPIFRRRAKSYSVLKQDVPKSKTFQITAIPLLLAVTNPTRSFALSTSSCNLQGMAEEEHQAPQVLNEGEEWIRLLESVRDIQLMAIRLGKREIERIARVREAATATENEASRESPSTSSQSLVLVPQQTVQASSSQSPVLASQQTVQPSSSRSPVRPAEQVARSQAQRPPIQAPQGNNRVQRSNGSRQRRRRVMMRYVPYYRLYRRDGTRAYLIIEE